MAMMRGVCSTLYNIKGRITLIVPVGPETTFRCSTLYSIKERITWYSPIRAKNCTKCSTLYSIKERITAGRLLGARKFQVVLNAL